MRNLRTLVVAALLAAIMMAGSTSAAVTPLFRWEACGIAGALNPPAYGLRLDGAMTGNSNHEVTWDFENVFFDLYEDGSAILHGTAKLVEFNNSGGPGIYASDWTLETHFQLITDPTDLSNIMGYNASWKYFSLVDDAAVELINKADANDVINLWEYPADGTMPFQVGYGANEKNGNFGAAGWVNFEHNDNGTVYGNRNTHWYSSDFLMDLKPVPEPATLTLFGLGALGLAAIRRKKS